MLDLDGGDQLLNLIGVVLVLFLVLSVATLVLAAMSEQQQSAETPDVDWNLQRMNESYVRITHAGGEPVQAGKLSVTVDGTPRRPKWTAITLTEGEYGVVRADENATVILLWQRSEAEREVLQQWQLSRATTTSVTDQT